MGDEPAGWLRPAPDGAIVRVHVVPRAARSGLAGFHGEALRVRVRGLGPDEVRARLAPAFSVDRARERN